MNSFPVRIFLCCVPAIFANGCNSSIDPCAEVTCDPNEACLNGNCVDCDGDEDCLANQTCVNGECFANCIANNDCDPNEECAVGVCVECVNDADCPAGGVCNNGKCFVACTNDNDCECNFDDQCNDENACTFDSCVDQACSNTPFACVVPGDCPDGCNAECLGGVCFDAF